MLDNEKMAAGPETMVPKEERQEAATLAELMQNVDQKERREWMAFLHGVRFAKALGAGAGA